MSGLATSWSRRRAAVAAEAAAHERAVLDAEVAEQHKALAEKTDAEILEDLGLPDPDDLMQGDDFKAFLSKAVPAHLRKRALRNLWRSNPVLACVDGLNDYDDDFLTGSFGQGAVKTSYQVGKGMLTHLLEMERQKGPQEAATPVDMAELVDHDEIETEPSEIALSPAQEDETPAIPTPRRMKFQFEDDTA